MVTPLASINARHSYVNILTSDCQNHPESFHPFQLAVAYVLALTLKGASLFFYFTQIKHSQDADTDRTLAGLRMCQYVFVFYLWGLCFVLWQLQKTHSITHLYTSQQYVAIKNMYTRTHLCMCSLFSVIPIRHLSTILFYSYPYEYFWIKSSHYPTIKANETDNCENVPFIMEPYQLCL